MESRAPKSPRVRKVSGDDGRALWQLRNRWLGIYQVALSGGIWRAARYHGAATVLTAGTAGALARKIQHDYESLVSAC